MIAFETIIGVAASFFTAVSLVPQLLKIIKEKKAKDVSLGMMVVLFAGVSLWVYYGILKEDWIIIIANSVSLVINLLTGFFTIRYKER
jgi:MtN3 and saliva related transmembrane protein